MAQVIPHRIEVVVEVLRPPRIVAAVSGSLGDGSLWSGGPQGTLESSPPREAVGLVRVGMLESPVEEVSLPTVGRRREVTTAPSGTIGDIPTIEGVVVEVAVVMAAMILGIGVEGARGPRPHMGDLGCRVLDPVLRLIMGRWIWPLR